MDFDVIESGGTGSGTDSSLCSAHHTERIFRNDLIIRKICGFLGVPGIKQFRSVCWDWKNASEVCFRAKVRINFASVRQKLVLVEGKDNVEHENSEGETIRKVPADINSFFQWIMANCDIPFTAVGFTGLIPWKTEGLCEFFNNGLGRVITDLRLNQSTFVDKGGNELMEYDISPMISPSIRKLSIRKTSGFPEISLSMDKLSSVDFLELKCCKLIYCGERIALNELSLHNVTFLVDKNEEEEITVNNYFALKKVKKLTIFGHMYKLDMNKEVVDLDAFSIDSTKNMINQENSRWKINTAAFKLDDSVQNVKIKNLIVHFSEINISYLPKTLEKLYCWNFQDFINTSATPFNLHNLEYVELNCMPFAVLDADLIPLSVSEIKIRSAVTLKGERTNGLIETVTVTHFNGDDLIHFLSEIQKILKPKHIITSYFNLAEKPDRLVKFIKSNPCQRMTLGKFRWELQKLKNVEQSSLSEIVEELAEFYVFENCRGIPCSPPKDDKGAVFAKLSTSWMPFSDL